MKFVFSIDATPEMRDGKPYCPGCDGGCQHCSRIDRPDDVHVMPTYGRGHDCKQSCWCAPELDFTAPQGAQVWVHKDMN
jgi:hypothetical protein